jgi:hypothetical protein
VKLFVPLALAVLADVSLTGLDMEKPMLVLPDHTAVRGSPLLIASLTDALPTTSISTACSIPIAGSKSGRSTVSVTNLLKLPPVEGVPTLFVTAKSCVVVETMDVANEGLNPSPMSVGTRPLSEQPRAMPATPATTAIGIRLLIMTYPPWNVKSAGH